jgi:hypothetical protein
MPSVELTDDEGDGLKDGVRQRREAIRKHQNDDQRRQRCESRASSLLKSLGTTRPYPEDSDLEYVLKSWKGTDNKGRKNAAGPEQQTVESDSFGLIKPLHLPLPQISKITSQFPSVVKILNLWLKSKPGLQDFQWTSICVNHAWKSGKHRDSNNRGMSVAASFGTHEGGKLRWWAKDDRKQKLDSLDVKDCVVLDIKVNPKLFDGTQAHATESFSGNRVYVIFFVHKLANASATDLQSQLDELHFNFAQTIVPAKVQQVAASKTVKFERFAERRTYQETTEGYIVLEDSEEHTRTKSLLL